MKKYLLIPLLLLFTFSAFAQTHSTPLTYRVQNTPTNSKDSVAYSYDGKIGNYSYLGNLELLRSLFKLKVDSISNSGYVTHGYFNAHSGGGGSTGINGLNGTTNIGLGGPLSSSTPIITGSQSFIIKDALIGDKVNYTQNGNSINAYAGDGTNLGSLSLTSNGAQLQYTGYGYDSSYGSQYIKLEGSDMKVFDGIYSLGLQYQSNYTTNQRLQRLAIPSVNTVIALADSVKATISGGVSTISGVAANGFTWSIANPTTTPAITLQLQTASTTLDGKLSHTDWNTFNSKQAPLVFQNGIFNDGSNNINLGGQLISGGGGVVIDLNGEQFQFAETKYNSITFGAIPSSTAPYAALGTNTGSISNFIDFNNDHIRLNFYNGASLTGIQFGNTNSGILITDQNNGIGLIADASIDTANITANVKAYVTNEWVIGHLGGGGSGITALTGDVTASGSGSVAATLATVNSNVGSFGDATHVPAITVNAKGLTTAVTSTAITFPVTLSNSVALTNKDLTGAGNTFPTFNQNTTGTALNITASSNSTLTTLSALSLSYSQLTGTPSLASYLTASNFVTSETPSGTVNSSNVTFTLANTPTSGTVRLFQNGLRLSVTTDYTISSGTLTFVTAPTTGDILLVDYQK